MKPTAALWQHALRVTFFTRPNCSLCTDAKGVLAKVWDRRQFAYDEIDVMTPGQEKWKGLYEFDTPVVWQCVPSLLPPGLADVNQVHIDRDASPDHPNATTAKARKLMHRFTEAQVEAAMSEIEHKKD
ncbi:hypothetical protein LTR36_000836 [Oleoguttula mirabilis]|uniref:Glutaredoxin-like protein n=1 Tax=Oleoguttula mirabilis TaxID=1507867 RepID=A0AAV9J342_9PEZI|nr:hypothetical protein LTR36_000836 [Oleoguttula mirabilis]